MKALTLKQPWAWAVIHGGKDIENRSWLTNYRGPLVIHAGQKFERDVDLPRGVRYDEEDIHQSVILGVVDVVDIVDSHRSKWFFGPYGWILRNPRALAKPIPCRGGLGLWNVPDEIARKITRQLGVLEVPSVRSTAGVRALSDGEKLKIRKRIETGRATNDEIAAEFGCAKSQVIAIKAVMNRR